MKKIEVFYIELNGIECRLYWCEIGGIESVLMGLNRVTYSSNDNYYDDCTIEEWVTAELIDGLGKDNKLIDDGNNVVIAMKVLDKETYYKE